MHIWVDGDACPRIIKDLLFRAAIRTQTSLIFVSNHTVLIPPSPFIQRRQVAAGFNIIDQHIIDHVQIGDLVITADIPFADAVITAGGAALNPRGELYTTNNIKQHLSIRNINESLRDGRMLTSGPDKLSPKVVQRFANALDAWLAKQHK